MLPATQERSARTGPLTPLAKGGQSWLYGNETGVVKVPRLSARRMLCRLLIPASWKTLVFRDAPDLLLPWQETPTRPFEVVDKNGRRNHITPRSAQWGPRLKRGAFLDRQFFLAKGTACIQPLREQAALLQELRSRGYAMLDFIMSNFAEHEDRLLISDPDMIVPISKLWQPSLKVTSLFFRRMLTRDYQRLLRHKAKRAACPRESAALRDFAKEFAVLINS